MQAVWLRWSQQSEHLLDPSEALEQLATLSSFCQNYKLLLTTTKLMNDASEQLTALIAVLDGFWDFCTSLRKLMTNINNK